LKIYGKILSLSLWSQNFWNRTVTVANINATKLIEVIKTEKDLLFTIECRIEGEKFVISSYRWSVQMLQEQYDNRDNLERLQFLVWDEGKVQFED